ncbi:Zinc finger protein 57 [Folsomia candida]|uniref:Zinc finger protein 57 n=1 Tax=Folsomia candida TaxID=158441 RepID=A0A226DF53_FOLCA|nr:Zinc finger protein 57 [Folsomia candida]
MSENPKVYKCSEPNCGKVYKSRQEFRSHKRMLHSENSRIKCDLCHIELGVASFPTHLPLSERQIYKCSHCPKQFLDESQFKSHKKRHDPNSLFVPKEFPCPFCQHPLYSMSYLREHLTAKHLNEKSHKCDTCEKSFGWSNVAHIKDYKRFECWVPLRRLETQGPPKNYVEFVHNK